MKKIIAMVLMAVLILSVVGCSREQELEQTVENKVEETSAVENTEVKAEETTTKEASTETANTEETKDVATQAQKRTIVDQNDREVVLPEKIERVATGRILPFPAVYFLATGSADEIVGMHPASKSAAENSILGKMAPNLLEAQANFVKGKDINVEELLKLNTDIVFAYGDNGNKLDVYDEAGITSVGIRTMSVAGGDPIKTLNSWLELLGQITEQEERAKEIIDYSEMVEKDIAEKLSSVNEKPRAMMLFTNADGKPVVAGKGLFGTYWLTATGAIDVAENDIKVKAPVDMEQIYTWDPEIIYVTNFTPLQPEDFYENKIDGQDWSHVTAVKNKQVYKIPLGIYRWFPPSGDTPLMLQWLAKTNHPEVFDYDMNTVIKDYYNKYYNYELTDDEVHSILHPSKAASAGYKGK